jgi:hypothetical protein
MDLIRTNTSRAANCSCALLTACHANAASVAQTANLKIAFESNRVNPPQSAGSPAYYGNSAQQPPEKIRPGDDASLYPPHQDQVVIDDIILGMFRLYLHPADHFAKGRAHIGHNDRAVPMDLRIDGRLIKQRITQKMMGIQYKSGVP